MVYFFLVIIAVFAILGYSDLLRKTEELERQITRLNNEIKILKKEW